VPPLSGPHLCINPILLCFVQEYFARFVDDIISVSWIPKQHFKRLQWIAILDHMSLFRIVRKREVIGGPLSVLMCFTYT